MVCVYVSHFFIALSCLNCKSKGKGVYNNVGTVFKENILLLTLCFILTLFSEITYQETMTQYFKYIFVGVKIVCAWS